MCALDHGCSVTVVGSGFGLTGGCVHTSLSF
jgi:hypothetical protein